MRAATRSVLKILCLTLCVWAILLEEGRGRVDASIVICAKSGKIYQAFNADELTPPASLTKMMTLYLTFKALREGKITLNQKIPVSHHATCQEPSNLWLRKGSFITVNHAIIGLITKSANDASVALAEALGGGSEKIFAEQMTCQARKLGMRNTLFKNATGLPNKKQRTTARDMAILSRAVYRDFPEYYVLFKTKSFSYCGATHRNHNQLLGKVEGVDGIKTGFTCLSGFNIAASMVRGGHRLIAVVLGGENRHVRDRKVTRLLEATYAKLTGQSYAPIKEAVWVEPCAVKKKKRLALAKKTKRKKLKRQGRMIKATYKSVDHLMGTLEPSGGGQYDSLEHLIGTLK